MYYIHIIPGLTLSDRPHYHFHFLSLHDSLKFGHRTNSSVKTQHCILIVGTHLAHGAVPACLHMVLALVASVDKAVLSLVVQLDQHAHGAPLAPPERAELPVFVPGQSQESVATIHQVTREHGVRVNDGRQGVGHGTGVEVDHKEHLWSTGENTKRELEKHKSNWDRC